MAYELSKSCLFLMAAIEKTRNETPIVGYINVIRQNGLVSQVARS